MKKTIFALGIAAGCACAGGPDFGSPSPVGTVSSGLVSPGCPAHEVLSRQEATPNGPGCQKAIPGKGGLWVGEVVIQTGRELYCRYLWQVHGRGAPTKPRQAPPDLEALRSVPNAEVDCPMVRPSAPVPLDAGIWEPLRDAFHAQAGRVSSLPRPVALTRVAVIDSAVRPYADSVSDRYGHGRAIGRAVADLACPDPGATDCAQRIVNLLALPRVTADSWDFQFGGYFGTRGQLAISIQRALDSWLRDRVRSRAPLVLNLSLGWEPTVEKRYPSQVATDVVHLALRRAACLGALSIAAAGNGSPGESGAILPADWERQPAPTAAECKELGFPSAFGDSQDRNDYRPLVYAVGGVDAVDRPLLTTRPGGQPRMVAYATSLTTGDPRTTHTSVLSGTSMAAAVVSGVAAAAWGYAPALSPHQIMTLVYETGVPLDPAVTGTQADLCLGGSGCDAHALRRASACAAVEKALSTSLKCVTVAAHQGQTPKPVPPGAFPPATTLGPFPSCAGPACLPESTEDEPWLLPQPAYPGCRTCVLYKFWNFLYADLDPSIPAAGYNLLRLRTNAGSVNDVVSSPLSLSFWASTPVPPSASSATVAFGLSIGGVSVIIKTATESIVVF